MYVWNITDVRMQAHVFDCIHMCTLWTSKIRVDKHITSLYQTIAEYSIPEFIPMIKYTLNVSLHLELFQLLNS